MLSRARRLPAAAAALAAASVAAVTLGTAPASAEIVAAPVTYSAEGAALALSPVGTYDTGVFDASAAEIVAHYPAAQRLLVVNAAEAIVEVLSVADATAPTKLFDLQTTGVTATDGSVIPADAVANSVAVRPDGLGAVAVESAVKTDPGWVVFFDANGDGTALGAARVGALPDSLVFTPDGTAVVVANEGEPDEDYSVDPEGSVAVIAVPATIGLPAQTAVRIADFRAFEAPGALPEGVRVFGGRAGAGTGQPQFPVSENLEPEYSTVSADSSTAWVALQEANAIAEVDLTTATVTAIRPLGAVDRMVVPFDASDRDGGVNIRTWPVTALPLPDTIASYQAGGATYLVTANEGDSRDWDAYSEVSRVADLVDDGPGPVCPDAFADVYGVDGLPTDQASFLADEALGRLNVTTADGFDAANGCFAELVTFGTSSFSILDTEGRVVFDSGDAFERITATALPGYFNSNHTESAFDNRSDDKGPEPEGVALGEVDGRTYAFIGFERIGGIAVFDVTDPAASAFVTYVNNRDFAVSAEDDGLTGAGDLGPEGLAFVAAEDSPTGAPLLAVGNEVSGSTTLYSVDAVADGAVPAPGTPDAPGSAAARPGELANTGAASAPAAFGAAGLVLAGAALLLLRRRSQRFRYGR